MKAMRSSAILFVGLMILTACQSAGGSASPSAAGSLAAGASAGASAAAALPAALGLDDPADWHAVRINSPTKRIALLRMAFMVLPPVLSGGPSTGSLGFGIV